jgi:hypothetical protein
MQKHHAFIQTCVNYMGDSMVRKSDLQTVIKSRLPVDDRQWFDDWCRKQDYDSFMDAFKEKYGSAVQFSEFTRYLNQWNFTEEWNAIRNGRQLRDAMKPTMAMLNTPTDRERAEWALLEKFKECLDPHDARQIAGEHRGEEVKTLDRYMECIQALERKSGTMVLIRMNKPVDRLGAYANENKHYEAYEKADKKNKKHGPQVVNMLQTGGGEEANAGARPQFEGPAINQVSGNGTNGNQKDNTVRCTHCNYPGHTVENCQHLRRQMGLPPPADWRCRKCQVIGEHYTPDCPNRAPPKSQETPQGNTGQGRQPAAPGGGQHLPLNQYDPRIVSILQGQFQTQPQGGGGQPNPMQGQGGQDGTAPGQGTRQGYPYNAPVDARGDWRRNPGPNAPGGSAKLCYNCGGNHLVKHCPNRSAGNAPPGNRPGP